MGLIAALGLCVILPFLWLGISSGHDFGFHMNSWLEAVTIGSKAQPIRIGRPWRITDTARRDLSSIRRFLDLGGTAWTNSSLEAGSTAYTWTASPGGMFDVCTGQTWLSQRNAIVAAMLYAANPYNLAIVYSRSDQADLDGLTDRPLPLLFLLRIETAEDRRRAVVRIEFSYDGGTADESSSAVMMNYSLGVLSLMMALRRRSYAVLLYAGLAVALVAARRRYFPTCWADASTCSSATSPTCCRWCARVSRPPSPSPRRSARRKSPSCRRWRSWAFRVTRPPPGSA